MKLDRYTKYAKKQIQLTKKAFLGTDEKTVNNYMRTNSVKKLQIGCGNNILEGWLNADLRPPLDNAVHLDATKRFPFEDSTFSYIFSEHVIEHLSYPEGINMLSECYRVMSSGSKIRIATPNLSFLFNLYKPSKSEVESEYLKWSVDTYDIKGVSSHADTFIINNFVRDWGHKFIYDEKILRAALEEAGFSNVESFNLTESNNEELKGLENIDRMPHDFLRLETMIFEATKEDYTHC